MQLGRLSHRIEHHRASSSSISLFRRQPVVCSAVSNDSYRLLGISPSASDGELDRAYFKKKYEHRLDKAMTQRLEKAYGFIRLQMLKNKNNMRNNYIPDSNQSSDDWNTLFNTTQETGSWAPLPGDTCDTDGGDSSGGPESSCDADDSD